jgi:hypothetical protein
MASTHLRSFKNQLIKTVLRNGRENVQILETAKRRENYSVQALVRKGPAEGSGKLEKNTSPATAPKLSFLVSGSRLFLGPCDGETHPGIRSAAETIQYI